MFTLERATDSLKCEMAAAITTAAPIAIVTCALLFKGQTEESFPITIATALTGAATDTILTFPSNPEVIAVRIETITVHNADSASKRFILSLMQNSVDFPFWDDSIASKKTLVVDADGGMIVTV